MAFTETNVLNPECKEKLCLQENSTVVALAEFAYCLTDLQVGPGIVQNVTILIQVPLKWY